MGIPKVATCMMSERIRFIIPTEPDTGNLLRVEEEEKLRQKDLEC